MVTYCQTASPTKRHIIYGQPLTICHLLADSLPHKKRSHVKEMLAAEKNTLSFSHSGDPQELMCGNAYLLT